MQAQRARNQDVRLRDPLFVLSCGCVVPACMQVDGKSLNHVDVKVEESTLIQTCVANLQIHTQRIQKKIKQ